MKEIKELGHEIGLVHTFDDLSSSQCKIKGGIARKTAVKFRSILKCPLHNKYTKKYNLTVQYVYLKGPSLYSALRVYLLSLNAYHMFLVAS